MKKYQSFLGDKKMIKDQGLLQHEEIRRRIKVLPELEDLIPPLQDDELKQLEENIIKEGCREALLVWETTAATAEGGSTPDFILIDGHNRYRICQKNRLDFKIHLVPFASLSEVKDYMIDNQLGRRNLTPEQTAYLRGKKYLAQKLLRGKYDRSSHKGQNVPYGEVPEGPSVDGPNEQVLSEPMGSTSSRLAQQFNVSEKTIKRDAEFAEGLDKLAPALRNEILSGKSSLKKSDIQQLAKVPSDPSTPIRDISAVTPAARGAKAAVSTEGTLDAQSALTKKLAGLIARLGRRGEELPVLCDEIITCASDLKALSKSK
jgi:hypothetical protein